MANSMAVIPAPVTGTGSRVPSGEACKSKGLAAWCVVPLRWFWASLLGLAAAVSGTFGDCAGCRGVRYVWRLRRMPRFLYPSHAPLDPALVFLAQFSLADLKGLARPDPEFANLLCHHRRHVHDPIAFERVHDLFAIASFDAFSIVPTQGYLDWGVGVES